MALDLNDLIAKCLSRLEDNQEKRTPENSIRKETLKKRCRTKFHIWSCTRKSGSPTDHPETRQYEIKPGAQQVTHSDHSGHNSKLGFRWNPRSLSETTVESYKNLDAKITSPPNKSTTVSSLSDVNPLTAPSRLRHRNSGVWILIILRFFGQLR